MSIVLSERTGQGQEQIAESGPARDRAPTISAATAPCPVLSTEEIASWFRASVGATSCAAPRAAGSLSAASFPWAPTCAAQAEVRTLKIANAREVPSVCPYCAVGCGQIVSVRRQRRQEIVNIEGNPESPINRGTLCPKGAATFQLAVNPLRAHQGLYREPGGTAWEEKPLDWAMDRIAQLRQGDARRHLHRGARQRPDRQPAQEQGRQAGQEARQPHAGHRLARRGDDGQRMELRPGEADAGAGGRLHRKPGPDMTQLDRARSGHFVWPRRRHHLRDGPASTPIASSSWARTWPSATRSPSAG